MATIYGARIGKVIFDVLSNDSEVLGYIGTIRNIQPVAIYNNSPQSGVFYDVLSVDNINTKSIFKAQLCLVSFQVECFNEVYTGCIKLSDRIHDLLDKITPGVYNGVNVQSCVLTDVSEDYNQKNNLYYRQLTFNARVI